MKKIKIKYWHCLLFIFLVVYFGAFLFFRGTADSRLSFYGDIINASGTFVGVLVAYFIMRIEINDNRNNAKNKEEKEIVLIIDNAFSSIKGTDLLADLMFIKLYSQIHISGEGMEISQIIQATGKFETGKVYEDVIGHVAIIQSRSNQFPKNNSILTACKNFSNKWDVFYADILRIEALKKGHLHTSAHIPGINNSQIVSAGNDLLNAYEELNKEIISYWDTRRIDNSSEELGL